MTNPDALERGESCQALITKQAEIIADQAGTIRAMGIALAGDIAATERFAMLLRLQTYCRRLEATNSRLNAELRARNRALRIRHPAEPSGERCIHGKPPGSHCYACP